MEDHMDNIREGKNIEINNKLQLGRGRYFPIKRIADMDLGTGSAGPFIITTGTVFTLPASVNIVSVPVDADDFLTDPLLRDACFCRGLRVLLTFIADISINPLSTGARFNFQIVRNTRDGSPVAIGPTNTFEVTTGGALLVITHAFEYIDKNIQPDDYLYSVQLLAGSTVSGPVETVGASVSIVSATLSATAAFI